MRYKAHLGGPMPEELDALEMVEAVVRYRSVPRTAVKRVTGPAYYMVWEPRAWRYYVIAWRRV